MNSTSICTQPLCVVLFPTSVPSLFEGSFVVFFSFLRVAPGIVCSPSACLELVYFCIPVHNCLRRHMQLFLTCTVVKCDAEALIQPFPPSSPHHYVTRETNVALFIRLQIIKRCNRPGPWELLGKGKWYRYFLHVLEKN